MAYEIPGFTITVEAGSDLSSDQFKLVTLASDGQIDVTTNTSTTAVLGVLQNKPSAAGRAAEVMVYGITKVIAGETIDEGEFVCPSSVTAGRVDDADTATDRIVGIALSPGDAGELISVLLLPGGAQVP